MNYCCDKFRHHALCESEVGLNIRIIKFTADQLLDKEKSYRFFITPGYKVTDRQVPTMNVRYCPWCGQDLFEFYDSDNYVNEVDTDFLYP
jgi:hypothetical protein